jgi:dCTP deaminase
VPDFDMAIEAPALFPELFLSAGDLGTGLLPSQKLSEAIEAGYIRASHGISSDQIQPSSIDLKLGPIAFRVTASFLPRTDTTVATKLNDLVTETIDLSAPAVLTTGNVYIVPLLEELNLPHFLWGKANPKSTTGRLDVFTRLLSDYADEFDSVPEGYKGKLYAEIAPRTFSIIVQEGSTLNQLRLVRGKPAPSESKLLALHEDQGLVYTNEEVVSATISKKSLWLSLDLKGNEASNIVGYKAKRNTPPIDLARISYYDPAEYWTPIPKPAKASIILNADDFYILASKERVRIPPDYAAEMVPFDPSVGEFRIHYAGFFDPGFGCRTDDLRGTHAVLEVRSHGIPFLVEHGQKIGRLIFEQMLAVPDKLYGRDIGSSYQFQGLALSKQFKR